MSVCKNLPIFLSLILVINLVECTEFVPVFMWSTSEANEKVPALHKISQDSFKDDILERLKEDPFVVIFAEQTLSPEDFAQRDQSGRIVFPHLSKLKKASKISYLPYVQNPIKALKHLDEEVTELSVSEFKENLAVPESNILIVNLNDAKDDEHRLDMLKRHDKDIMSIFGEIAKKHENVLALYTAHHTSWVAPEEVVNSRKIRSLLAVDGQFTATNYSIIYLTNATIIPDTRDQTRRIEVNLVFSDNKTEGNDVILTGTSPEIVLDFNFMTGISAGYWELTKVVATYNGLVYNLTSPSVYAPTTFSYHCGDQVFSQDNFQVNLTYFQVQIFLNGVGNRTRFSDAYDCVGFTSVPIWSGIFVTAILLLIMTFGITMMMDIRTMDRFDDAKGKTITINAE